MRSSEKLASFTSKVGGATLKTLVITDLTYMWGDEVCVAGIDEQGNNIRPVTPQGLRRHHLFRRGRLLVYPRARVQFKLSPAEIVPPHIEDRRVDLDSIVNQGECTDSEWEDALRETCFPSVAEIFDGHMEGDRTVPPNARTRSLGTVKDVRVLKVRIEDSYDRRQFRLDFLDPTGKSYHRFPINDLAFRSALQQNIEALGDERKAERVAHRALRLRESVYVRIGLARPQELGDYPLACWTQVTGVHTFPDYLECKTFADFV